MHNWFVAEVMKQIVEDKITINIQAVNFSACIFVHEIKLNLLTLLHIYVNCPGSTSVAFVRYIFVVTTSTISQREECSKDCYCKHKFSLHSC